MDAHHLDITTVQKPAPLPIYLPSRPAVSSLHREQYRRLETPVCFGGRDASAWFPRHHVTEQAHELVPLCCRDVRGPSDDVLFDRLCRLLVVIPPVWLGPCNRW